MANALKKIILQAKKLRKRHKSMTWKGAVKKASSMYKKTGLKTRKRSVGAVKKTRKRKRSVAKRRTTAPRKKATRARRTVVVIAGTRKRRRSVSRKRAAPRRRRVGSSGKDKFIQTLVIGGLAIGLIVALTRQKTQTAYVPTGDPYRDTKAQQILSYATAAGATIAQISNLINTINQSSNSQLEGIDASLQSGSSGYLAGRLNYN